jgi:hypothetical protein
MLSRTTLPENRSPQCSIRGSMEVQFTTPYKCRKHGVVNEYYVILNKRDNKYNRRCKICAIKTVSTRYRKLNPKKEKVACKIAKCEVKHFAKGFCSKHYTAFMRGNISLSGQFVNYKPKRTRGNCTFGSCSRLEHGSGLCNLHRKWLYRGYIDENNKILVPEKCRERKAEKCKVCGDTKVKGRGFCATHYSKFRRGMISETGAFLRNSRFDKKTCSIVTCFSKHRVSKGLCLKHYTMRRAGLIDDQGNKVRELKRVNYKGKRCKICPEMARAKSFCHNHFSHFKKGNIDADGKWLVPEPTKNQGKICKHPGCEKEAKIKLLCPQHRYWEKTGFVGWKNKGHKCSEDGCGKPAAARLLCHAHYRKLRIVERALEANAVGSPSESQSLLSQ